MTTIWIEKYRPINFTNIIGQDKNIKVLDEIISNGSLPHLLFYGKSGVGKTSTIMSLVNKLYGKNNTFMVMKLDASDDRGINTVREEIKGFADKMTPFNNGIKMIILDEADSMTYEAQFALRRIIEKYSDNTRFCLICNYENKIIPAIKVRCLNMRFNPIDKNIIISRIKNICDIEMIKYNDESLNTIAIIANGDLRKAINMLQSISMMNNTISPELCYDSTGIPSPELTNDILDVLNNKKIEYSEAYDYINIHIVSKGILISFLLHQITNIIIADVTKNINYPNILIDISNLECEVAISTFDDIYMAGLVAIFKKY